MRLSITILLLTIATFGSYRSHAVTPDPLTGGWLYAAYDTVVSYNSRPKYLVFFPASGGSCTTYQYEWQQSENNGPWQSIGTGDTYPATAPLLLTTTDIRVKVVCGSETAYSNSIRFLVSTTSLNINYIREEDIFRPGITDSSVVKTLPVGQKSRSTTYYDGLNRSIQIVKQQFSGSAKDLVYPILYDTLGNELKQLLPYNHTQTDGSWKALAPNEQPAFYQTLFPGQPAYQQTGYELSPQRRQLKVMPPGSSWTGNNRGNEQAYELNTVQDSVVIWRLGINNTPIASSYYGEGQLFRTVSKDEQGNTVVVFTDKNDIRILTKTSFTANPGTAHVNWLCTYYVYDDFGKHRYTISPKATEILMRKSWSAPANLWTELCFRFDYDNARRLIVQQVPGAAPVEMVYDVRNRLIFSRDGNLQAQNKWLAIFYDELNRPRMKALYSSSLSRASLQQQFNNTVNSYPATLPAQDLYPLIYFFYDQYDASATAAVTTDFNVPTALPGHWPDNNTGISNQLRDLQTGWKARVLGAPTDQWVTTTLYYNLKGRNFQRITGHITGGQSITTHLFDFNGRLLSRYEHHYNPRSTATSQTSWHTQLAYDQAERVVTINKGYGINPITMKSVNTLQYNDLGQLQTKTLGSSLESLSYLYHIRGWLKSMNAGYLNDAGNSSNYFGFELSYDNPASAVTGASYSNALYNGNIAGTLWRSRGDGAKRKYDFFYDKANRLLKANFLQSTGGSWTNAIVDYSMQVGDGNDPLTAYDPNGNIKALLQKGYRLSTNSSPVIDNLQYEYLNDGNKLKYVKDATLVTSKELGDFTESAANYNSNVAGTPDYTHDDNGNLTKDDNKGITLITYNVLNLPQTVSFGSQGSITYLYDATGRKLQKKVIDNTNGPTKTTVTDYADNLIYVNDTLKQSTFDEGRIRALYKTGQPVNYTYDYFIKDHLSNVRSVLTEQTDFTLYKATMETNRSGVENALFSNIDNSRTKKPVGYPAANGNEYVARLNAQDPDKRVGPSLVLKVMAGDTVQIAANAFFKSTTPLKNNSTSPDMVGALLNSFGFASSHTAAKGASNATAAPFNNDVLSQLNRIRDLQQEKQSPLRPKAYLSYVLFDEQMKMVENNSGVKQVQEQPDQLQTLAKDKMTINKNGFLYVYTSNESNQDVYFDDVTVAFAPGPLLEETHYYPYGLTMTGISTRAAGRMENKHRYSSKELQNQEMSDGTGLDWYDYDARIYDPQIGRWHNQDPHATNYYELSPYNFVNNNPLIYVDPTGKDFAIYFEQAADGTWSIRITATYYVKKGDQESKESADAAVEYWNNRSGEFVYRTGTKKQKNIQDYVINFDLKVVEVDDPGAEKLKDWTGENNAKTRDKSSNTYEMVKESDITGPGVTTQASKIKVRASNKYGQSGRHEIGHTLMMEHASGSVMDSGNTEDTGLWPSSIMDTLKDAMKGQDTNSGDRHSIHGNLPRGGRVVKNPNHVSQ